MVPLHGLQFGLTWTWGVGLPPGPHPDVVTQVPTWASFGPGESGLYLVVTRNWYVWSPPGNNLGLVNLVPIWASSSPGDFVPHLDLIAVDSFLASPGTGDSDPICPSPRPVTLVLTWASLVPGDSVPHLSLTWT